MECTSEYCKFFRIRTPVDIAGVHTIDRAIRLIDFDNDSFLRECIFICQIIPGCFSYKDLLFMDFSEYEKILEIAKKINKDKK